MKSFLLYSWTITLILLLIIYEACEKFYALLQTITAKFNIRQMHHIRKSPKLVSINKRYLKVIRRCSQKKLISEYHYWLIVFVFLFFVCFLFVCFLFCLFISIFFQSKLISLHYDSLTFSECNKQGS